MHFQDSFRGLPMKPSEHVGKSSRVPASHLALHGFCKAPLLGTNLLDVNPGQCMHHRHKLAGSHKAHSGLFPVVFRSSSDTDRILVITVAFVSVCSINKNVAEGSVGCKASKRSGQVGVTAS